MKLGSVLSTTHLNVVQFIYLVVLETVITLSGALTLARGTASVKGQRKSICRKGVITIFLTISMLGKRGQLHMCNNGGAILRLRRKVNVIRTAHYDLNAGQSS